MEDARGGLAVDVGLAFEGVLEVLVARDVGKDPQLDLAVIGGEQRDIGGAGHEGAPDPPSERRPDRDVLQVWVGRRQAARRGDSLVERRVQAPIRGHQRRQRLDVRRAQLRVDPPFEQLVDHRMSGPKLLEHRCVGRIAGLGPFALRQVQLEEEDLLELFWATEVELVPDIDIDLALEAADLGGELAIEHAERLEVERHADRLHLREDRYQRQLDLAEQPVELELGQPPLQRFTDGDRRQGFEARSRGRRQLRGRRKDLVEVLGDDVCDRLAPEGRIEDVGGDLRVERDRWRRRLRVLGEARDEDGLHFVPDERDGQPFEQVAEHDRVIGAVDGDDTAVGTRHGEGEGCPPSRARIVEEQAHPDGGLGGQPRLEVGDVIGATDFDPAGVDDRGRQRRRQIVSRGDGSFACLRRGAAVPVYRCRHGPSGHGVEVKTELELAALRACPRATRPPALGATGDPGGWDVSALHDRAKAIRPILRALP